MKLLPAVLVAALLSGGGPVFAETVFSCLTAKNNKQLRLMQEGGELIYTYGKPDAAPELSLKVPLRKVEFYAWEGVGRAQNYIASLPKGDYWYRVYQSYDSLTRERSHGVLVEKADKLLAEIRCKPGSVSGDLMDYVLKTK